MLTKIFKKNAFTLIEMLIAISIFMIFLTIVAGSYISLVSANRKADDIQKTYHDVENVFETMAQEVRSGPIDYACVDPSKLNDALCIENQNISTQRVLSVLHNNGLQRTLIKFDPTVKKMLIRYQTRQLPRQPWSGGEWQPLTSEKFPLEDLSFKIRPLADPYDANNAADDSVQYQPSVTATLKAQGLVFTTTYSSRTYGTQTLYAQ